MVTKCFCVRPFIGWKSETGLSFSFRTLRVYSTQKKRVAFNVSKMLAGAGAEGEVGDARALRGGRASVEAETSLSSSVPGS